MSAVAPPGAEEVEAPSGAEYEGAVPGGPSGGEHSSPTRSVSSELKPTSSELIDAGCLIALGTLALVSFHNAYGGTRYLAVGIVGLVAGCGVAFVSAKLRWSSLLTVAVAAIVFVVVGSAAVVPESALFGVLPSPRSVAELSEAVVAGWARLLTTAPPAGSAGGLMAVPYLGGFACGLISFTLSRRSKAPLLAALLPFLLLTLGILFGTSQPVSLLLNGALLAALTIFWFARRAREQRRGTLTQRTSRRWFGAVVTLIVAVAVGSLLWPHLPGAASRDRFVLRTSPPFDPAEHPSPLAGYRRYTDDRWLRDSTLFKVQGLAAGERLRLATLDTYDGVVYKVGGSAESSGVFQRTGSTIATDATGPERQVTVEVESYSDVWVPDVGHLKGIEFEGPRSEALAEAFVYNSSTGSAASTVPLRKGDRYRFEAVLPPEPTGDDARARAAADELPAPYPVQHLAERAAEYSREVSSGDGSPPYALVAGLRDRIKEDGRFSDGRKDDVLAAFGGHGSDRLAGMVEPEGTMVGNGEQYGPLLALMARSLGVPARVVMGFEVKEDSRSSPVAVKGEDVDAWIEIELEGVGWVPIADIVTEKTEEPKTNPQQDQASATPNPPPPPPVLPVTDDDDALSNRTEPPEDGENSGGSIPVVVLVGAGIVLMPFLVLAAVTSTIAGLKRRRRERRRTTGDPATRISGGWDEVTDLAHDLGSPVPRGVTRAEAAAFIDHWEVSALAGKADRHIFGPGTPSEAAIEEFWQEVDSTTASMTADLSRFERWRMTVSLASLRESWRRRRSTRRDVRPEATSVVTTGAVLR